MINVTFQIVVASATHDTEDEAGLHRGGELLSVWDCANITEPPTIGSRLGFGHITDIPTNTIHDLKPLVRSNFDAEGNLVSRATWRVDSSIMTLEELVQIGTTNELTATWERFKEVCRNVVTGALLTDEDI